MDDVKEDRAKVFWSGRSQAVRLPKAYRFDTDEVIIRREGDTIVLEPVRPGEDEWGWIEKLRELGPPEDDFVDAVLNERPGPEAYERRDIDFDS